jgi:hypothetical protein
MWETSTTLKMMMLQSIWLETLAEEFPEFLLMVAEENYIRGYEQALDDVNSVKQKYGQQATVHKKKSKKRKNK